MHARDARVCMKERPRCVLVDERPMHFAATQLVKRFAEEFDPQATVERMCASATWPGVGYAVGARPVDDGALDARLPVQVVREGRVQHIAQPGELTDVGTASALFGADVQLVQYERAMTKREVLSKWDAKADVARTTGIAAHERIDSWFRDAPSGVQDGTPEAVAARFVREHLVPLGAEMVATEWCIFDEDASVVASVDAVARFGDGTLALVDWKHTVGLGTRTSGVRRLEPPLAHLPDCDVVRYALQLAIYAQIVERHYGCEVRCLALVNTHPDDPYFTDLPYLRNEARFLLEHCASLLSSRPPLEPACASDGKLALDPVRCEDGSVRSRKVAQASGMRYRAHADLAATARQLHEEHFRPTRREQMLLGVLRRAVAWEDLFPQGGVQRLAPGFQNFEW